MSIDIQRRQTIRQGIEITFRGCEPDANGEPSGEFIEIEPVVPPLNFDALESLEEKLQTLTSQPTKSSMSTLVDALIRALMRNYTGVPRWLITQTIDVANMSDMMVALMDVSGLKRKEIEDAKKAVAVPPMNDSDGTISIAS